METAEITIRQGMQVKRRADGSVGRIAHIWPGNEIEIDFGGTKMVSARPGDFTEVYEIL